DNLDEGAFEFEGVTKLQRENGVVSFFYKGDINKVTQLIGGMRVSDVVIEEPTLEEIFIHYYE
ncbi:MAG: hypothetical protein P8Y34_11110, partial [Anaerolineales bacterium]